MATLPSQPRSKLKLLLWLGWCALMLPVARAADATATEAPLVVGNRTIHVFRDSLGDFSAQERRDRARIHIEQGLANTGEGWTSISPSPNGIVVALDGQPMFTVSPGDARQERHETAESLANQASRVLQKVWAEAHEHRQPGFNGQAMLRVIFAVGALAATLTALFVIGRFLRVYLTGRLSRRLMQSPKAGLGARFSGVILRFIATLVALLVWLLSLLAVFATLSYCFAQFAVTRPFSENLLHASREMLLHGLRSSASALPGLLVALIIFALARLSTQVSRTLFDQISAGRFQWGTLDAHTAPATRYLVNAAIWLFAVAMAYPYLPGSQTEAFKGVSVLLGVMVSIGAAGPVGQIASGLILAYTRAVRIGEYVRIQDSEGTVTHLGLCVTRLRTGAGEEIALPNSVVIGNVTRNFSRHVEDGGQVVETSVTIGYDTPWRQVHALLLAAAGAVPTVRKEPAPFVAQTALSDFYVEYRLVVQADLKDNATRLTLLSELNAAIQDAFNRAGVQIMSPHYLGDPATAKIPPAN